MKKFLAIITTLFLLILTDIILSKYFGFLKIKPNIWLIHIVYLALFVGHTESTVVGFLSGMIIDILHLTIFGLNTFALMCLGYFCGWVYKRVDESLFKVKIIFLFLSSILFLLLQIIISKIFSIPHSVPLGILLTPFVDTIIGYFFIIFFIWYYRNWKII